MTEKNFNNILKSLCRVPEKWGKNLSLLIWSRLKGLKKWEDEMKLNEEKINWKEREENNYSGQTQLFVDTKKTEKVQWRSSVSLFDNHSNFPQGYED